MVLKGQNNVLDLIARDVPLESIFVEIAKQVEALHSNVICGIAMLDADTLICVAPSLPADLQSVLNTKQVADDIRHYLDKEKNNTTETSHWEELHNWAIQHQYSGSWSKPIFATDGSPVGTFSLLYTTPVQPNQSTDLYDAYARITALAIDRKQAKQNIFNSEQKYKSLFDNNLDAVYQFDLDGCFVTANKAFEGIFGYSQSEVIGIHFLQIVVSEDAERAVAAFEQIKRGQTVNIELDAYHKSGERRKVQVTCLPIQVNNEITGILCIAKDITSQKHSQDLLASQKRILEMIAKRSSLEDVLLELTKAAEHHASSSMCNAMLLQNDRNALEYVTGNEILKLYNKDVGAIAIGPTIGASGAAAFFKKAIIVEDIATDPLTEIYRDIALRHGLRTCAVTPIMSSSGNVRGTLGLYFDKKRSPSTEELEILKTFSYIAGLAVERKQSDDEIEYLAHIDPLTGLPNRTLFHNQLTEALQCAVKSNYPLAVMFLDLDRFKSVNDSMGHGSGDRLLQIVANRVKSCLEAHHVLSRMGGDEFTILIPQVYKDECLESIARRVSDSLNEPIQMDGIEFRLTFSIGIAVFPDNGDNAEALMRNADTAMYAAKDSGKNTFRFYTHSMNEKFYERLLMETSLRQGLENGEFILHYQPRVETRTKSVTSIEALLRWNRPDVGITYPGEFIPIAEETGLIVAMGRWIFHEVCRQLKAWEASGKNPVRIAVNVSPRQFKEPDFMDMVKQIIAETEVNPQWLEIEVTESSLIENGNEVCEVLSELKTMGIKISIDDFGVGYSSLDRLRRMPVDALKIDRSFVQDMFRDNTAMTRTIIALAHSINLNVVAEGVETDEQFNCLRTLGCHEIQGYFITPPIPVEDFEQRYMNSQRNV